VLVWLAWIGVTAGLFGLAQWLHGGVWPLGATFTRWDGAWYYSVVQYGYGAGRLHGQSNVAFFPLYPILVTGVQRLLFVPGITAAVGVSVVSMGAALVVFYDMVRRRYHESVARWATLLLAFNPFGLFFGFIYTESLYLLLSVAVFWLLERRAWWWAAVVAGLASASRPQGAILALIVVAQWLWSTHRRWWPLDWQGAIPVLKAAGLGLTGISGLVLFAAFLQLHNHDALAFAHVQVYWGRTGVSNLWPAWQAFVATTLHHTINHHILFSDVVWYVAIAVGIAGAGLLLWQREYWFAAYVVLGLVVPLASGSIEGMDRYVMVLFPIYIAVARALQNWERRLAVVASGLVFSLFWLIYLDPRQLFFG
jgi:mannosyltransferase PIG-V